MSHLRLVKTEARQVNQFAPRPFKVFYSGGGIGHCKSLRSAIVAATRHMLRDGIKKVTITHENVPIADVAWAGFTIAIKWSRTGNRLI